MTHQIFFLSVALLAGTRAFVPPTAFGVPRTNYLPSSVAEAEADASISEEGVSETAIRAPLKFVGPYPCLGLHFPNLATDSQRSRDVTGISLDFVLDTAANTNTINAQVAKELQLQVVGSALPGVASSGVITGGDTFMLGDSQLEGLGEEPFTFMQDLTASALPIASPASAGLLSLAFFNCFEGGVEFDWGSQLLEDGSLKNPPSVTFYGEQDDMLQQALSGLTRVRIDPIPMTQLPSVTIKINGVEMAALLDTGSPITVLNSQAAQQAGVETVTLPAQTKATTNPFAAAANRFKEAQAVAQAATRGDILTIAGTNGQTTNLLKSTSKADIALVGETEDVSFGRGDVYVGDIPGLAALNGIGVESPPAVVLGMDVLKSRPKMLLRARDNEVYF
jgi:hypothetical protein